MKKNLISLFLSIAILLPSASACLAEESQSVPKDDPSSLIPRVTGNHVRYASGEEAVPMQIYSKDNEIIKTVTGSDYCQLHSTDLLNIICGPEDGSTDLKNGEFYLYFYNQDKIITWDVFDHTDECTGERNRVTIRYLKEFCGFQFSDLPEGYYVRIAPANGHSCRLLIWDGNPFGYPLSALSTVFNEAYEKERLPYNASASVQIPSSALYLIAKPGYTFINMVTSNTKVSEPVACSDERFPSQVISLKGFHGDERTKNISIVKDYNYNTGEYSAKMPNGDLSEYITVVDSFELSSPSAIPDAAMLTKIQDLFDFTWEAKADLVDNTGTHFFKKGVTYSGVPYRSSWVAATCPGWHVSKQTFMNAANDPDSIFYHNPGTRKVGPYYSLVCSSYATLVAGFPYPATNFSIMKDPQVTVTKTEQQIVGTLMTNGYGHCYIPLKDSSGEDGSFLLALAEQIGPLTSIRNVYNEIPSSWKGIGLKTKYPEKYVYSCEHQTPSDIPYDITICTIKNGSARPFRGDQSVYTSAMDVLINIKDPSATRLYYQEFEVDCDHGVLKAFTPVSEPSYIQIEPGTAQVSLRSATGEDGQFTGASLKNSSIYGVWASVGDAQAIAPENAEYFEWYDLEIEKITYSVSNGALITDDVFWYAMTSAANEEDYISEDSKTGNFTIPYQAPEQSTGQISGHSDYSNYADRAQLNSPDSVYSFFRKGRFGAYVTGKELLSE